MNCLEDQLKRLGDAFSATPVVSVPDDRVRLFAKLEFSNPHGSSKDRSAFWILKKAIERGDLAAGAAVVESSSGNFAISMASYCRLLGLEFIPVIDPNCNATTEGYLRTLCRRVEKVTEGDGTGGYLRSRLERVQQVRRETGAYWPDQYSNTDALEAHYRLTGQEIADAFDDLDYLFVGVSTGGTVAGLSCRLKKEYPDLKVIAVDSAGSAVFGEAPQPRRIPGIGSSIVPPLVGEALIDEVMIVPERQAAEGCLQLFRNSGLYAGGSTGSVYSAIRDYFSERPVLDPSPSVLFLCADRGIAYTETVYNRAWVTEFLDETELIKVRSASLAW